MTPQREDELLRGMLAHQVGIEPDRAAAVLDLAAVGVVNNAWRNGPVEDWHAGDGPLNDGDMLRINAHTSWRIRQIIRRWRYEVGLPADADAGQLDDVSVDDWDWLAVRVWRWLVNPQRLLPGGFRLIEIAGNDLADYNEHVAGTLGAWATTAEKRGGRYAAWRAATHGGGWRAAIGGARRVGDLVHAFVTVLDEPSHRHWGPDGQWRRGLRQEPVQVQDRSGLRKLLLRSPWLLDQPAAQWVVAAGIGHLLPPMAPLHASTDIGGGASRPG